MKNAQARRATNVSLRADLVEEARALGVNLSSEFEAHLKTLLKGLRSERWRLENRKSVDAYAKFVERHGIWNEDTRGW